ncbi:hypothetical protein chiPu_0033666 [Chiloscyllium punctatum]|uniref:Uncharacterized protein n=1 Tax=Chiloscyllium punctatum TaxID=137246 RepID=A0A401U3B3_CHIPU|nr:hypothetical protein [Chiloscyllium punctatum]
MLLFRCDEVDAEPAAGRELGCGVGLAADPLRSRSAAAACEVRQALQRVRGVAKMAEQRCKGTRADIVGADQPQAVEPFDVGEFCRAGRAVMHGRPSFAQPEIVINCDIGATARDALKAAANIRKLP